MQAENQTPAPHRPAPHRPAPHRPALDAAAVQRAVVAPGRLWRTIEVTPRTGSTNADLLARASQGAPEGTVLVAEEQSAGRGRLGRAWVSPPRAALTFSLLLRPEPVPPAGRGWLPLLAGLALASAVPSVTAVPVTLKWPNDLMAGPAKLAGILAEAAGDAVVIGIGLNVSTEPSELPPPGPGALPATSLRILGASTNPASTNPASTDPASTDPASTDPASTDPASTDPASTDPASTAREPLLTEILTAFERWYQPWRQAAGDPEGTGLRAAYTRLCATVGQQVRVECPGAQLLSGLAVGVDPDGRLVVRPESGPELAVAAGDVVHLR
jgi:BirA family transcriptional regulator, biotin operon repressor / biotin---[acetyl-CoA-carboxylase] ligase